MMNDSDLSLVEKFKCLMGARGIDVRDVILFGSRARGDADPDSDLYVLVVVEKLDRDLRKLISHCAWEVSYESGIILQSVVMTKKELAGPEKSSLFMLAVEKEGIRL